MSSKLLKIFLVLAATIGLFMLSAAAFAPTPNSGTPAFGARSHLDTRRYNFFENAGSFVKNFGRKVTASHILIGPKTMNEEDAKARLLQLKAEIGDDPEKFAQVAMKESTCRTKKNGGDLGEFGPGLMIKPVDMCCFGDEYEVGKVHGPISSMYGEHLILIRERTDRK